MDRRHSDSPDNSRSRWAHVWRRGLVRTAWISGAVVATSIFAVLVFIALLNVDGVHRYLLGLAQRKATAAVGVPITLENFRVDVPALRVDLYGLTIAGAAPYRTRPLLQVNHIEASVRIVSIFHLKWYLNRIEVDHPVAWIVEGKDGESNLPAVHGGTGKTNINLFSLAIRNAVIKRGELYFNDHPKDINADLVGLELEAGYNSLDSSYNGEIGYKSGRLQIGETQPLPHSLQASFILKPDIFLLHRARLASGKSSVEIAGSVRDFSRPVINARYETIIDGAQMKQVLGQEWLHSGLIRATGILTYRSIPSRPMMESMDVNGEASSEGLELSAQGHVLPIKDLNAHYSVAKGAITLQAFHAALLGGEVAAEASENTIGSHQGGNLRASIRGIGLRDAEDTLLSGSSRPIALSGSLNGTTTASWGKTLSDLVARTDLTLSGKLARTARNAQASEPKGANSNPATVPLTGAVHARYTQENGRLELANTAFHTSETSLLLNGTAGKRSSIAVRLESSDLGEVAWLGSLFAKGSPKHGAGAFELAGRGSFRGNVSGVVTAPHMTGYVEASHLSVNGSNWKSFHANVGLNPSSLRIDKGYLAPESQGSIRFSAGTTLHHWSFSKTNSIEVQLNTSNVKVSDLMQVTQRQIPVSGIMDAVLHLRGSVEKPEGSGTIRLRSATAYTQPISSAVASFSAGNRKIDSKITVEIAGGHVNAHASVIPDQRHYAAQILSTGIHLDRLEYLKAQNARAQGILTSSISGAGSFDNPNITGYVRVAKASIEGQVLSGVDLHVNLANRIVNASISSKVADAPLEGRATLSLTGNYPANVSLDTQTLPLQPLLALYAPDVADELTGQTQVHLELHGPLKDKRAVVGQVTIPVLNVSYNKVVNLAAEGPIHIDYQSGNLRIQPVTIHGTDTDLRLQGAIPLYSSAPPSLEAQGNVNLQIAQLFDPGLRSSGMARINIHTDNAPGGGLAGQIDIIGAGFSYGSVPIGLQDGNGVLTLSGNRLDITKFTGSIGGGSITAQGGVSLRPKLGFDLGMTATNVRMIYPQGMWEDVNANLRFTGSTDRALLGGTVGISDISFTPGFDLTSMAGQFSTGVEAPTAPGFSQDLFLNIAVHSTNVLNPTSRTMNVAGTAALTVRGTAAHPALTGRVNLNGGSMIFNGNQFVLTGGTIEFVNPNQIRPVLNLSLSTTIQQYDIVLRFTGPADQIRGEFTSNPSLPRADIISLLAFGTTTEAKAANATPANQAAESMIASQVSSQVTSRISKIAGISQLSISPVLTSGTAAGTPGAVITIRQQVTGNLFITFSTNVASTQDETFQAQYKLSPKVSVSATRDPNGGFAVDTLIKKTW